MRAVTVAVVLAVALAACGGGEPPEPREAEGREETRGIRNTEAIGYSGDAIADKVDAALDASEERKKRLDEALEADE